MANKHHVRYNFTLNYFTCGYKNLLHSLLARYNMHIKLLSHRYRERERDAPTNHAHIKWTTVSELVNEPTGHTDRQLAMWNWHSAEQCMQKQTLLALNVRMVGRFVALFLKVIPCTWYGFLCVSVFIRTFNAIDILDLILVLGQSDINGIIKYHYLWMLAMLVFVLCVVRLCSTAARRIVAKAGANLRACTAHKSHTVWPQQYTPDAQCIRLHT